MTLTAISDRDVRSMLGIAQYAGDSAGEALPWELLRDLKRLVECDLLSASGQDTPKWEFFANQEVPGVEMSAAEETAYATAYLTHYWDSECSYPDRSGDIVSVWRQSDRTSRRDHESSGMYQDYGRPLGVEHELMVCLDAGGPQRTLRLLFVRGPGPDFSDRDVAVLTLLRPHLQAAYVAAERRRRGVRPLTARQREILQYVAAGHTNRQIARRLEVSEATVSKHLENIFARLDVTSRTAAVARL